VRSLGPSAELRKHQASVSSAMPARVLARRLLGGVGDAGGA